ncbi:Putative GTP cyclohydrolase URC1 [Durusdinium trenchii]|uniref:GTP cyclohydrolase URC1 n=1 Tax=Durusdinium trenchii TaxID=1381693 RepID=A0ABP0RKP7_9DINO
MRVRTRRRAVLMEQTDSQEDEGFHAQVPRAILQDLAAQRDVKTQAVSSCQTQQEQIAKKVVQAFGPSSWDYRLEAQYCIFFKDPWSLLLDRLEEDSHHFRFAIHMVDKLPLETRLEELSEELLECRGSANELARLHDEVRRRKITNNSFEAEVAAEASKQKLEKQCGELLRKFRDWSTQVNDLDLNQIFEAAPVREARVQKMQLELQNAQKKIEEGEATFAEAVEENE